MVIKTLITIFIIIYSNFISVYTYYKIHKKDIRYIMAFKRIGENKKFLNILNSLKNGLLILFLIIVSIGIYFEFIIQYYNQFFNLLWIIMGITFLNYSFLMRKIIGIYNNKFE